MAKGSIDPNLAEALRANPNVLRVTARTVVFTPSFIEYALSQYLNAGKYNRDRPQPGLGGMTPVERREFLLARPQMLPAVIGQPASENGLGSAA